MTLVRNIGLELEIPIVGSDYKACTYDEVLKLFQDFVSQGWKERIDGHTKQLVGVYRLTPYGIEAVETDLGVCTLEVALPPIPNVIDTIEYWNNFKKTILFPNVKKHGIRLLGYGNQPISYPLNSYIAHKGHYEIYKNMMPYEDVDWFLDNFPGFSSVQFNFEIPKEKTIEIVNSFLRLSPLFWAISANDGVYDGKISKCISHRLNAFLRLAKDKMEDRFGLPSSDFKGLCEYISRTWSVPVFEILREGKSYFPENDRMNTHDFISRGKENFISLNGEKLEFECVLDDLYLAIYFSWLDYRIKFFFKDGLSKDILTHVIQNNDEVGILDLIDHIVLKIRPCSMQNLGEEVCLLVMFYLLVNNITQTNNVSDKIEYIDVKQSIGDVLLRGLNAEIGNKKISTLGIELLNSIPINEKIIYSEYLDPLLKRLNTNLSPSENSNNLIKNSGMSAFLQHITLNKDCFFS